MLRRAGTGAGAEGYGGRGQEETLGGKSPLSRAPPHVGPSAGPNILVHLLVRFKDLKIFTDAQFQLEGK